MKKDSLIELVNKNKGNLNPDKLLSWINSLPNDKNYNIRIKRINKGDVIFHKALQHPFVILDKTKKDEFIGCLLTSNSECPEILEKAKSRMFPNSYITKNLILLKFTDDIQLRGLYDNPRHLKGVHKKLKSILI